MLTLFLFSPAQFLPGSFGLIFGNGKLPTRLVGDPLRPLCSSLKLLHLTTTDPLLASLVIQLPFEICVDF